MTKVLKTRARHLRDSLLGLPLVGAVLRHRFVKFGSVGLSGTLINIAVLFAAQEYIFDAVEARPLRINLSLSLAIFCATINNFVWNRLWTWRDRSRSTKKHLLTQFAQYGVSCWLAIVLQIVFTNVLAAYIHYLLANVIAIALAAVLNYLINDAWTFGLERSRGARRSGPVVDP